jgi:hypothetical protein
MSLTIEDKMKVLERIAPKIARGPKEHQRKFFRALDELVSSQEYKKLSKRDKEDFARRIHTHFTLATAEVVPIKRRLGRRRVSARRRRRKLTVVARVLKFSGNVCGLPSVIHILPFLTEQ